MASQDVPKTTIVGTPVQTNWAYACTNGASYTTEPRACTFSIPVLPIMAVSKLDRWLREWQDH